MKHKHQPGRGLIFVVSGPSGSGKSTLLENLFNKKAFKKRLAKSVSLTTRPRRSGERHGKDYFFISEKEFLHRRRAKKILEWTRYLGYYYATPKEVVDKHIARGRHIVLCLDLRGALRIKRLYPHNAITIFIVPPSLGSLRARIEGRCRNTKSEEIKRRIGLARRELASRTLYDYCLINRDLARAGGKLERIITGEIDKHL